MIQFASVAQTNDVVALESWDPVSTTLNKADIEQ